MIRALVLSHELGVYSNLLIEGGCVEVESPGVGEHEDQEATRRTRTDEVLVAELMGYCEGVKVDGIVGVQVESNLAELRKRAFVGRSEEDDEVVPVFGLDEVHSSRDKTGTHNRLVEETEFVEINSEVKELIERTKAEQVEVASSKQTQVLVEVSSELDALSQVVSAVVEHYLFEEGSHFELTLNYIAGIQLHPHIGSIEEVGNQVVPFSA